MSDGKVQMQGKPRQIFANAEELEQYRLTIPEITKIALELNKKGMNFVGTIVIYSYLQAIGIINSHDKNCFLYKEEK